MTPESPEPTRKRGAVTAGQVLAAKRIRALADKEETTDGK